MSNNTWNYVRHQWRQSFCDTTKMLASRISDILLEPSTLKQHSKLATDANMSIVDVMLFILEDVMQCVLFY